jgi:hypothetical protein
MGTVAVVAPPFTSPLNLPVSMPITGAALASRYKKQADKFQAYLTREDPFTKLTNFSTARQRYLTILSTKNPPYDFMNNTVTFTGEILRIQTGYTTAVANLLTEETTMDTDWDTRKAAVKVMDDDNKKLKAECIEMIAHLETPEAQITAKDISGTGYIYPAVASQGSSPTSYTYRYNTNGEVFMEIDLPTGDTGYLGDY